MMGLLGPYRDPEHPARCAEGLRQAGLPELITGRQLRAGQRSRINTHLEEGERGKFPWPASKCKLAPILAADVVGYSRLLADLVESPQRVALAPASPETSTGRGSSPPTQR